MLRPPCESQCFRGVRHLAVGQSVLEALAQHNLDRRFREGSGSKGLGFRALRQLVLKVRELLPHKPNGPKYQYRRRL